MKILITGHKGFIGKALYNELNTAHEVFGLESSEYFDDNPNWRVNLNSILCEIMPDVIFHVGACSDTQNFDVNYMLSINSDTTIAISQFSKKYEKKLIYSSSAACYGTYNKPETIYAWSKYFGERFVHANNGISLRYFNVYGYDESHKDNMSSIAFQSFMKHKIGERVLLFPQHPVRDFVYIKDVVSANIYAMENYNTLALSRGVYDVGTSVARKFEDVLNIMNIPFGYTPESSIPNNYQFRTEASSIKFMERWEAKYDLEKGLEDYLNTLKVK
jgi:ADP-L-glycero-D-manno-heptose 6-epimerase